MKFSKTIQNIKPSATVSINSLAQQKKSEGIRVFNLSAGEAYVNQSKRLEEAAIQAIKENKTKYPPVAGLPELRKIAAEWMNNLYGTSYDLKETLVTAGGKFGIFALCQALLNKNDEVLIVSPYWVSYPGLVSMFNGNPIIVNTFEIDEWKTNPEDLERLYTNKTKILILNNASNPTGALYSKNELHEILKWAKSKDLFVISDEVYSGLVYDNNEYISCGKFSEYKDNLAIIQSVSKHFAMTGWRIGITFAPEEIIQKLTVIQGQATSGAPTISQWAALAAFENAEEIMKSIREEMQKRRNIFIETFELFFQTKLEKPKSSLYAFVPIKSMTNKEIDSVTFCRKALEIGNVALVPGVAFGQEDYIRFSFGVEEQEIKEALQALYNSISKF